MVNLCQRRSNPLPEKRERLVNLRPCTSWFSGSKLRPILCGYLEDHPALATLIANWGSKPEIGFRTTETPSLGNWITTVSKHWRDPKQRWAPHWLQNGSMKVRGARDEGSCQFVAFLFSNPRSPQWFIYPLEPRVKTYSKFRTSRRSRRFRQRRNFTRMWKSEIQKS